MVKVKNKKQTLVEKGKIKYKARTGSPFKEEEAQAIGEEINSIVSKTPTSIVEFAKNPTTTLHHQFDWSDDVAGEKWRLQQARNIVSHIVEYKIIEGETHEVKSFFNVNSETQGRVYVTNHEATTNKNYRKQLLSQMKNHLENVLRVIELFSVLEK